jgi:cell wall-associated NlpC family hydrolase
MFEQFRDEILRHAVEVAPEECLGVIYDGKYIRLENAHPEPEDYFQMSTADAKKYVGDAKLEAVVHSHPPEKRIVVQEAVDPEEEDTETVELYARMGPSAADMRQQMAMGIPWVLAAFDPQTGQWKMFDWGDHTLDLPVLERPFVHGIEDCYTLIRKWYWQNQQIKLGDYPRDDFWWEPDHEEDTPPDDLYMQNFAKEGFVRIHPEKPNDLEIGDVFLFKLGSKQYNHGGVYTGKGLIIHHPPGKYSLPSPLGPYFRRIDVWLRRAA